MAETEVETEVHTSREPRPDVDEILDHLNAAIVTNDPEARLPVRNKTNADAARLLIDRDERPITQIKAVIDWSQQSDFWRPNIRSMSKLREKYDVLRGQAQRAGAVRPAAPEPKPESTPKHLIPNCPTCGAPQAIVHYDECPDQKWRPGT